MAAKQKVVEVEEQNIIDAIDTLGGAMTLKGRKPIYFYYDEDHERIFISKSPITKKVIRPLIDAIDDEEEKEYNDDED